MLWHIFNILFFVNACVSRTLIQGDKKAGFTVFWADDGLDTGPILLQRECAVEPNDTVDTLYNRFLFPEGIKAMVTNNYSISRVIGNILSSDPSSSQDLLTLIFILVPIMPSSHSAACIFWDCQNINFTDWGVTLNTVSLCRWSRCSSLLMGRPLEFRRQRKERATKAFRRNPTPRWEVSLQTAAI